ncbi:MAG: hypothetical protein LBQ77_00460 [Treponema sp.]|jgi:hypothetical protein|nr:hypothetical protein [Treponema sp.]
MYQIKEKEAYKRICKAFKDQPKGATAADIVTKTALPLSTVRKLSLAVIDEFSGRLQVTESGEILYSFPHGWKSKYHGSGVMFKKMLSKCGKGLKIIAITLFKFWVMIMLIGYLILFMALAVIALIASSATRGESQQSDSQKSPGNFVGGLFNSIIRLWFYSSLLQPSTHTSRPQQVKKPLHKAIFSFVFGDGDPHREWTPEATLNEYEKRSIIAFIQKNKGCIALPEFIILTGLSPTQADSSLTTFCAEYGGSPEVTKEGTLVYQFNDLMLRTSTAAAEPHAGRRLRPFSSNAKAMNIWFCIINSINVLFGAYFLLSGVESYLHAVTIQLFSTFLSNPDPVITVGLGIVPFAFSVLFWIIPLIRLIRLKRENTRIKMENFRRYAYNILWSSPQRIQPADFQPSAEDYRPSNLNDAQARIIKEVSVYAIPDISIEHDTEQYSFPTLAREAAALDAFRTNIRTTGLGATVFDSDERL